MPATITVVNGRTVISAGENTLEAARQAAIATEKAAQSASARDAAIAFLNPYPDQAAGEAATADGDLFSFRDGDDMVALAKREAVGSTLLPFYFGAGKIATDGGESVQGVLDRRASHATRAAMAIAGMIANDGDDVYLAEGSRRGKFIFHAGDWSAEVANDPLQGVYVASSADATGAAGAWVRAHDGVLAPEMFGATGDFDTNPTADDTAALVGSLRIGREVRGFGHYRQTGPVQTIDYDRLHLSKVTQSGAGAAFPNGTLKELRFTAGSAPIAVGDTVTGAVSGATGTVERVIRTSGGFAGGDCVGRLILSGVTGSFLASGHGSYPEAIEVGGVTKATQTAATASSGTRDIKDRGSRLRVENLTNENGAGHVCPLDTVMRTTHKIFEYVKNNDAAAKVFHRASDTAEAYHCRFECHELFNATSDMGAAQPLERAWHWSGSGARFNDNFVVIGFGYGSSTQPMIQSEVTDATYNYRNTYELRVGEIANAGGVWLAGEDSFKLRITSYDASTITGDIVRLYATGGGLACRNFDIDWQRTTGTCSVGVYDINVIAGTEGTMRAVATKSTTVPQINSGNNTGLELIDSLNFPAVITGETTNQVRRRAWLADQRSGNTLTVSGGVVTLGTFGRANRISRKLATEGGAATDDVDQIVDIRADQEVFFASADSTKDLVLKHDGDKLILDGAADKTLDNTKDGIMLKGYATGKAKKIAFTYGA